MRSKDMIAQEKGKLAGALAQAIEAGSQEGIAEAMAAFSDNIQQAILSDAMEVTSQYGNDSAALAARGVRQLTAAENKYYTELAQAMGADGGAQNALKNISVAMPETIIDSVMEDIKSSYPLLDAITFQNATALTKWIFNKQGVQTAQWGALTSAIAKELSGEFGEISLTQCKLSAFMAVSKDFLALGPQWLDRYVRAVLVEANAATLEAAVVDGTGKDMPIGMTRSVAEDVTVTGGVYPQKEKIAVSSFDPATFGGLVSKLTKTPTGRLRPVSEVLLIVNPTDYMTKVMPATTFLTPSAGYASNVFPFPTRVIQSAALKDGEAVMGLPGRYFMGMGSSKNGVIEYSDEYQFLEDNRVYTTRLYGNGMPMDDNAFLFLDISGLVPASREVTVKEVKGVVKTKEQA